MLIKKKNDQQIFIWRAYFHLFVQQKPCETAHDRNGAAHAGETMQACELARSWLLWNSNDRDRGNSCRSMQGFSVLTRSLGGAVVAGGSVRLRGMRVCAGSGLGYRSYRIHSGFLGVLGWRWVEGWGLRLLSIK